MSNLVERATPRTDALMEKWDDDGASRGPAFIELRDLARELERQLASMTASTAAPEGWNRTADWLPNDDVLCLAFDIQGDYDIVYGRVIADQQDFFTRWMNVPAAPSPARELEGRDSNG